MVSSKGIKVEKVSINYSKSQSQHFKYFYAGTDSVEVSPSVIAVIVIEGDGSFQKCCNFFRDNSGDREVVLIDCGGILSYEWVRNIMIRQLH